VDTTEVRTIPQNYSPDNNQNYQPDIGIDNSDVRTIPQNYSPDNNQNSQPDIGVDTTNLVQKAKLVGCVRRLKYNKPSKVFNNPSPGTILDVSVNYE
ncbi:MAG: hypothetical protein WBA93_12525, partial [Microcoleaceae cyanobacterium]